MFILLIISILNLIHANDDTFATYKNCYRKLKKTNSAKIFVSDVLRNAYIIPQKENKVFFVDTNDGCYKFDISKLTPDNNKYFVKLNLPNRYNPFVIITQKGKNLIFKRVIYASTFVNAKKRNDLLSQQVELENKINIDIPDYKDRVRAKIENNKKLIINYKNKMEELTNELRRLSSESMEYDYMISQFEIQIEFFEFKLSRATDQNERDIYQSWINTRRDELASYRETKNQIKEIKEENGKRYSEFITKMMDLTRENEELNIELETIETEKNKADTDLDEVRNSQQRLVESEHKKQSELNDENKGKEAQHVLINNTNISPAGSCLHEVINAKLDNIFFSYYDYIEFLISLNHPNDEKTTILNNKDKQSIEKYHQSYYEAFNDCEKIPSIKEKVQKTKAKFNKGKIQF